MIVKGLFGVLQLFIWYDTYYRHRAVMLYTTLHFTSNYVISYEMT